MREVALSRYYDLIDKPSLGTVWVVKGPMVDLLVAKRFHVMPADVIGRRMPAPDLEDPGSVTLRLSDGMVAYAAFSECFSSREEAERCAVLRALEGP